MARRVAGDGCAEFILAERYESRWACGCAGGLVHGIRDESIDAIAGVLPGAGDRWMDLCRARIERRTREFAEVDEPGGSGFEGWRFSVSAGWIESGGDRWERAVWDGDR